MELINYYFDGMGRRASAMKYIREMNERQVAQGRALKRYKDLNLKKIMKDFDLDFAHYTYLPGQCTCCYGPWDMASTHWKDGIVPKTQEERNKARYIIFKNADNGSGIRSKNDFIEDETYIEWNNEAISMQEITKICEALQEQLGEEYKVYVPQSGEYCICIRCTRGTRRSA